MGKKQWILHEQHSQLAQELAAGLSITPLVAQILINRGITTVEAGRRFLQCDLAETPDPFLMSGMDQAVNRIQRALDGGEQIVVYGDYDADGQTATALLVRALRRLAADPGTVSYYLPDRFDEGYGLNSQAVVALSDEADLLISVDCGIVSHREIIEAHSRGLDVIVTDHHEPGPELPPALAVLNPKQKGCAYPCKDLAGVGIALKLVQGLGVPGWEEYLELAALGTVADLVPLRGENRTIVKRGLERMRDTKNVGLRALMEASGVEVPTAYDLGFRLGPRLNAGGRLGDSARGVRLLLTEDGSEARELAAELSQENTRRQQVEMSILEEAVRAVEKYGLDKRPALVVWGENWHQGVVGIVASRLVELYYRPTVVISVVEGEGVASARSIAGLHLFDTLSACAHLLTKFGGHAMAAGLSLPRENLTGFQKLFEELCAARLTPVDYLPKVRIDAKAQLAQITSELVAELNMLEPHGVGNPYPLLQAEVSVLRTRKVGAENQHLQLTVQDGTVQEMPAIAFGAGADQRELERLAEAVDLAFVPTINEWKGCRTLQLQVREWQAAPGVDNYVRRWMVEAHPWKLGPSYYQSSALQAPDTPRGPVKPHRLVDLRGTYDKIAAVRQRRQGAPTLILVNRAVSVLEVCRALRIGVAGGSEFIGFEHEWLSSEERAELGRSRFTWLVSTGLRLTESSWPAVWLWEPPLTPDIHAQWASLVEEGGEMTAVYGPKDVRELQMHLQREYPDRNALARIYLLLREGGGRLSLAQAADKLEKAGLVGALPAAMGVFSELGLWAVEEGVIIYLPAPDRKLDLEQAVLYNKITKIRDQAALYLKRCLERGFFQDGLKREN
ncbi:MAG: single-stranded-DNA-specific exonuclease RecJ [Limnochordia bacterium]|jgi:single-stranded-DNA-specific exonuclease|nr:single-stranded-DNA-specific exonuclease RecJ [Bacillota bacterium]NLL08833.1 single-stranded-DNA-specific exonuclease RecJ [Bacillota bacterium]